MFENETSECPLCMEAYEIDDLNFFPCVCGYQVCRFCWHRIRNDENGLCPACRTAYTEDPAVFQPLTSDEVQRIKKNQRQKDQMKKQQTTENRKHFTSVRVVQKNLLFVVGLSNKLADADVLKRNDMLGKYGKILKIVINPCTNYAGPQGPSASAYITFTKEEETQQAILGVNNVTMDGRLLRASLGTTKYCSYFLKNAACPKTDCMYLHEVADQEASFSKEDMQLGKHQIYEKNLLDRFLASISVNDSDSNITRQTPSPEIKTAKMNRPGSGQSNTSTGSGRRFTDRNTSSFTYADSSDRSSETGTSDDWQKDSTLINPNYPALPSRPVASTATTQNTIENGSSCQNETELPDSNARQLHYNAELNKTPIVPPLGFPPEQHQAIPDWSSLSSPSYEATSEEDKLPTVDNTSLSVECGLGLSNLHISNDDDLDFDPFEESNIGLTSLINQESTMMQSPYYSHHHQQQQHHGAASGQHDMRDLWSQPLPSFPRNGSLFQRQSNEDHHYSLFGSDVMKGSVCNPSLLVGGPQLFSSNYDTKQNNELQKNPKSAYSQFPTAEDLTRQLIPNSANSPNEERQQQASLRALLPDVNISFTGQSETKQSQSTERSQARRPPPGFERPLSPVSTPPSMNDPSVLWSKIESAPVPMNDPLVAGFKDLLTKGDGSTHPSTNKPLEETRPRRNPSEQTRMTQPVTPWTSVVRTSLKKTPSLDAQSTMNSYASSATNHPTSQTNSATIAMITPSTSNNKSSPFSSNKFSATEKPTAKVKPLNHTTSPTIRIAQLPDLPVNIPPAIGRNMNELDDFEIDEPTVVDVIPKTGVNHPVQPAPINRKESTELPKSKKKKKGKKQTADGVTVSPAVEFESKVMSKQASRENNHNAKRVDESNPDKQSGTTQATVDSHSVSLTGSNTLGGLEKDMFNRLAESTEKLLQSVLCETEAIKSNTEQISKDLKTAIERGMDYPPTRADLVKINSLLHRSNLTENPGDMEPVDTAALEKQVETAKWEATLLEAKLNDLIRKNVSANHQSKK